MDNCDLWFLVYGFAAGARDDDTDIGAIGTAPDRRPENPLVASMTGVSTFGHGDRRKHRPRIRHGFAGGAYLLTPFVGHQKPYLRILRKTGKGTGVVRRRTQGFPMISPVLRGDMSPARSPADGDLRRTSPDGVRYPQNTTRRCAARLEHAACRAQTGATPPPILR